MWLHMLAVQDAVLPWCCIGCAAPQGWSGAPACSLHLQVAPEEARRYMYDLIGIVVHYGTPSAGHYYSYNKARLHSASLNAALGT